MNVWTIADQFGIENLVKTQRPNPTPGSGQVVVRIKAVSLNYRDLLMINGQYYPKLPRPRIPCSDGSGEVISVGPDVKRFKVGDRVIGMFFPKWLSGAVNEDVTQGALGGPDQDGVMAEEVLFSEESLILTPAYLSDAEASTLPCAALTAWNALVGNGLNANDTILIQGTGGVSIFALQFAKLLGAAVLVISSSDEKLKRAYSMGAAAGLNYRKSPDWEKWVKTQTRGRGVDHVVEVGGAGTLERSAKSARVGGRIALIGVLAGGTGANPMPILMRSQHLRGIFVGSRAMFADMLGVMERHQLKPIVDRQFTFEQFPEALRYLESGLHFGKVVVNVA